MWLLYSLLTVLFWGLWGFVVKVASRHLEWYQLYVLSNFVALVVSALLLAWRRESFLPDASATLLGILAGIMGTLGYILFILATKTGKVSIVVPLTATYPAITFLLGVLVLRESVQAHHALGLILAILGAVLLSV
ncbi:MAG: EamA family transporter [Thermotogae bacterium]|nr:EamA family transporter [Thermotogota bacterium]